MDKLLFGVAYYDEYMPYDRLEADIAMMKAAGFGPRSGPESESNPRAESESKTIE